MTAKKISKVVTAGLAATNFDAKTELGGEPHHHSNLTVTNVHASAIIAVAWGGVTAAINGDDVRHIGPLGWMSIPFVNTVSIISNTAATPVEIAGS